MIARQSQLRGGHRGYGAMAWEQACAPALVLVVNKARNTAERSMRGRRERETERDKCREETGRPPVTVMN